MYNPTDDRLIVWQLQAEQDRRPEWEKHVERGENAVLFMQDQLAKQFVIQLIKHTLKPELFPAPEPTITRDRLNQALTTISETWVPFVAGFTDSAADELFATEQPAIEQYEIVTVPAQVGMATCVKTSFGLISID